MKILKLVATNTRFLHRRWRSHLNRTALTTFCQHSSWLRNSHRLTWTNLPWVTTTRLDHIQKSLKAILFYLVDNQNFCCKNTMRRHPEAMSIFWEETKVTTIMPHLTMITVLSVTKEVKKMKKVKWLLEASRLKISPPRRLLCCWWKTQDSRGKR